MLEFNPVAADVGDAKPSATVVVVRDGDRGIEALLLQRNPELRHMPGAWVFPGGKVDPEDPGETPVERARHAAVRELKEESQLDVAAHTLLPFSHWVTPVMVKRRFATWFWLATVSDEQTVVVDDSEIVDHRWLTASEVLSSHNAGDLQLPPPTLVSLCDIAECADVNRLIERVQGRRPPYFFPKIQKRDEGLLFLYPGDAGYETEEANADGPKHRSQIVERVFSYQRDYEWPSL